MRYHNITKDDMLNGYGLRVVLWVAGCGHHCPECHNPITHDPNGGIEFDSAAKEELFKELEKDYIDGVTFSGGDPLHPMNITQISQLVKEISLLYPNKTKWLYTGYTYDSIKDLDFIPLIDVLCDGRFEMDKFDAKLHWVGSSNQRVIDVKKTLEKGEVVLFDDNQANAKNS